MNRTDGQSYTGADSGCADASDTLGYPSKCQECPYSSCIYDNPIKEEAKILQMYIDGMSLYDIAQELKLDWERIQKVIEVDSDIDLGVINS